MSKVDIMNRWIVLGTDSKARSIPNYTLDERLGKEPRIPMGEKGIGRLSVSYLGPTMLMVTKKKNDLCQLVFLDWRILDNYNLFLEDLDIPMTEMQPSGDIGFEFQQLVHSFRKQISTIDWKDYDALRDAIESDLRNVQFPQVLEQRVLNHILKPNGHGTCFIIFNPNEQLLSLSFKDKMELRNDASLTHLRSSIGGLFNAFLDKKPSFETSFLIHDQKGKYDIIDEFFTREEMEKKSDHWVSGEFDAFGNFSGQVRVFRERFEHFFRPNRPPGETLYGPLKVEFGVLEGVEKNSLLSSSEWSIFSNKLNNFGGLYIYRDDFRVLPYGRTEHDFLGFETRRSKSATYYFISHRRMMGYVAIKRESNPRLKDKAGREGFIDNQAFRDFRSDLIAFFIDFSVKHLRTPGKEDGTTTRRSEQVERIRAQNQKILENEKKKRKNTKNNFLNRLKGNIPEALQLQNDIEDLNQELNRESNSPVLDYNFLGEIQKGLDVKKAKWRYINLKKPHGISISDRKEQTYLEFLETLNSTWEGIEKCNVILHDLRLRFPQETLEDEYNRTFSANERAIRSIMAKYTSQLSNTHRNHLEALEQEKNAYLAEFKDRLLPYARTEQESVTALADKIQMIEQIGQEVIDQIDLNIAPFINHVGNLSLDIDDDFLEGWYREQNDKLEQKLEDLRELSQLGASVEIIDHQFNVLYSQMADSIGELNSIIGKDTSAEHVLKQLQIAFQHLEQNHKLLKPLYRSSRRTRMVISGKDIEAYIREFFRTDFKRYRVTLEVTPEFSSFEFFTFKSVLFPVIVNIVNNAVFWMISQENRKIRMAVIDSKVAIMNSGEKIDEVYLDRLFTLFFSRKPDGRGIGLYLAQTNLEAIGYHIHATNDPALNQLKGACFVIEKID